MFERYEGAYRTFVQTPEIERIFELMGKIGTIFAISEMMDTAHLQKRTIGRQFSAFLYSYNPNLPKEDNVNQNFGEFFKVFEPNFERAKNWFQGISPLPNENEILPPFVFACAQHFSSLIQNGNVVFHETSQNLLDIHTLKGFAAVWSVLEFIFCLIEVFREEHSEKQGSVVRFGEGVQICAAAILCLTSQRPFYRCLSIGRKIQTHVFSIF